MLVCGWMHGTGERKRSIDDWGGGVRRKEIHRLSPMWPLVCALPQSLEGANWLAANSNPFAALQIKAGGDSEVKASSARK